MNAPAAYQKMLDEARSMGLSEAEYLAGLHGVQHPGGGGQVATTRQVAFPRVWTCSELIESTFPEPVWAVPGLIPAGLTILAGSPKIGKSWLALHIATALSIGGAVLGQIKVPKAEDLLYLALEDTPRRLKNRLDKMGAISSVNLNIVTEWPRGPKAIELLDRWMEAHPDTKVVIIDTLQRVRALGDHPPSYAEDYSEVGLLKSFADRHGIAVIVLTHTRKMAADDYLHMVTGTTGISAAADTVICLTRTRGQADAVLSATGRDIDEQELALRFDTEIGTWNILGDAAEYRQTSERQEILSVLKDAPAEGMKTAEIATATGKTVSNTSYLLARLRDDKMVISPKYGRWLLQSTPQSTQSPQSPRGTQSQFEDFEYFEGSTEGTRDEVPIY